MTIGDAFYFAILVVGGVGGLAALVYLTLDALDRPWWMKVLVVVMWVVAVMTLAYLGSQPR